MTRTPLALLVTTALVVPTFSSAQTAETACADLGRIIDAGLPAEAGDHGELVAIVQSDNGEACFAEVQRLTEFSASDVTVADTAETTLRLQDEVTIAGRVLLNQTPPRVDVTSGDTEVEIEPGAPNITVSEQAGNIVVRQAPANITIDMPTPTIRIEQAAPEIIITMPDPSVTVGAGQPQVRVVQSDPVISVVQAPPGVELELSRVEEGGEGGFDVSDMLSGTDYRAGDTPEAIQTEDAEVRFTSKDPVVTMIEPKEGANVRVERAEPSITFEQTEPVVNFAMAEPKVEFMQSGEPTITFERADVESGEPPAAVADLPQADATEHTSDATAETGVEAQELAAVDPEVPVEAAKRETDVVETEAPVEITGPSVEREGYNLVAILPDNAADIIGTTLYDIRDENIGEIGDLVLGDDGAVTSVIVEIGGFLGLGETNATVPFERLSILQSNDGDIRAYIDATEEELEAMPTAN